MARTPSSRRHGMPELEDIDLTPIMSILVILIPMLIYAFNYTEIAVQRVSLPKTGGRASKGGKKKTNVTILVSNEGFRVKLQGEPETGILPPDDVIPKAMLTRCPDERDANPKQMSQFNYPALYSSLIKLKHDPNYGLEDSVNIGAKEGDRIPWRIIAKTIAAVRVEREKKVYSELCDFSSAPAKTTTTTDTEGNEVEIATQLFPEIVFIVL